MLIVSGLFTDHRGVGLALLSCGVLFIVLWKSFSAALMARLAAFKIRLM